jgi:hypothetical protein
MMFIDFRTPIIHMNLVLFDLNDPVKMMTVALAAARLNRANRTRLQVAGFASGKPGTCNLQPAT